jgi:hypothetical protein
MTALSEVGRDFVKGGKWPGRPQDGGLIEDNAIGGHMVRAPSNSNVYSGYETLEESDWARVCMKSDSGYLKTNPYDGKPLGDRTIPGTGSGSRSSPIQTSGHAGREFHKRACCDLYDGAEGQAENAFCHKDYCAGSDGISQKCRTDVLKDFCDDIDNFKNSNFCKGKIDSTFAENEVAYGAGSGLTGPQRVAAILARATSNSRSLTNNDYKVIGKKHCRNRPDGTSPFEPNDENSPDELKLQRACELWCKQYPDECYGELTDLCNEVYTDTDTTRHSKLVDVCACNWPASFYTDIRDTFINEWYVPANNVSDQRACLFHKCRDANIGEITIDGQNRGGLWDGNMTCPDMNILNCIQTQAFNVDGDITVSDSAVFNLQQTQSGDCQLQNSDGTQMSDAEYSNLVSTSSESNSSSSSNRGNPQDNKDGILEELNILNEEGKLSNISIGIIIICISCCCFFIILIIMSSTGETSIEDID